MNKHPLITQPVTFDAVLEPGLISGDGLQSVRVLHPDGELAAWTWHHFDAANTDSVLTATVSIHPLGDPVGLTSVIDRIQWQPALQVIDLIPEVTGTAKLVARFRALIDQIRHPGMQQLLQDVFALRPLFYNYWNTTIEIDGAEPPCGDGSAALFAEPILEAGIVEPIDEPLAFRFVPQAEHNPDEELEIAIDDCDDIEFSGTMIDPGEAVAQSLALAIDPFAEGPGAEEARRRP